MVHSVLRIVLLRRPSLWLVPFLPLHLPLALEPIYLSRNVVILDCIFFFPKGARPEVSTGRNPGATTTIWGPRCWSRPGGGPACRRPLGACTVRAGWLSASVHSCHIVFFLSLSRGGYLRPSSFVCCSLPGRGFTAPLAGDRAPFTACLRSLRGNGPARRRPLGACTVRPGRLLLRPRVLRVPCHVLPCVPVVCLTSSCSTPQTKTIH